MIKFIIAVFLVLIGTITLWAWQDYQKAINDPVVHQSTLIEIKKGDTFNHIIQKLKNNDVSIKPVWFKALAYRLELTNKMKTGEFELTSGLNAQDILALFVEGKSRQYEITFPEGWNFREILDKLKNNKNLVHTLDYQNPDYEALMMKLGSEFPHPEGLFYPDTYFFEKNMTDFSLLQRAFKRMKKVLAQEWQDRDKELPLKTPYEALILASIVEKETAVESERPIIAGVFKRRLEKGMLLQTDPTVIYGMGESFDGNIRIKDLRTATVYNTYVIKGLPPTPIAMPGKKAIHAVLHPEPGTSLYFVARGDGSHVFSGTLKEHNQAVNVYQRKRK